MAAGSAPAQEANDTGAGSPGREKLLGDVAIIDASKMSVVNFGKPDQILIMKENPVIKVPFADGKTMVTFRAETMGFEKAKDVITATGDVVIEDGTHTIHSHTMTYNGRTQRALFAGKEGETRGVHLSQKIEGGDRNYFETDWMTVTFGDRGIEQIDTGAGSGEVMFGGMEQVPGAAPPAGEETSEEPLPRIIAPPPIDE